VPLMVSVSMGLGVIVNALAPGLNTIPFTSVLAEREMLVVLDVANVAVSDELSGMVDGVQLLAVFQSPEPGLVFHVALPAKAMPCPQSRSSTMAALGSKPQKREDEQAAPGND
jgi:hypothetical protein